MIPKRIFTIWLNDKPGYPELIERCIKTHEIPGYEHVLITLGNRDHPPYVQECIQRGLWAKAADYLRMWYLFHDGGIYLDADVEVLPGKNFDAFLDDDLFCGEEENGFVSNAIVGAVPGHPVIEDYLGKVDRNFKPEGELVFQPGMFLWTEIVRYTPGVKIYRPEYFLPYNHHLDRLTLTEKSITIHHFSRSWKP